MPNVPPSVPPAVSTVLDINMTHNPMAFLYDACRPIVEIDSVPYEATWGRHIFHVGPGNHTVRIFFKYMWLNECGKNSIHVDAKEGGVVKINFHMPSFVYSKGRIKIV